MIDMEVMAYHGWGFDADCWQAFEEIIPQKIRWLNADRGYFGKPASPDFSNTVHKKIIITHSFGLHLCPAEQLARADMLVIISGFGNFHPKAAPFQRRSEQVVNEMMHQFEDRPRDVLKAFYRNVFHPEKIYTLPPDEMNQGLLLKDLKRLNKTDNSLWVDLRDLKTIYIIHGTEDAIVPKRKGRALRDYFKGPAQYFEIKDAGHALPMTHPQKCWSILSNCLMNVSH